MGQQVKSRQRVSDHGEVFTAEREVNAMLDLVKQETERVAAGTRHFPLLRKESTDGSE